MAPTFRHGKGGIFTCSDTGGTTFTLSSGLNECSLNTVGETADVTTFGDNDRAYIAGLRNHTLSLTGLFSSTHEARLRGMVGNTTASNFVFGPQGNTAGFPKLSGAFHLTAYDVSAPVADVVTVSLSGQITGAVASGTF